MKSRSRRAQDAVAAWNLWDITASTVKATRALRKLDNGGRGMEIPHHRMGAVGRHLGT